MTIPNLLVSKHDGTGSVAVFELIGGTSLQQIGSNITTSKEAPLGDSVANNRVIEFKGNKLVWHQNEIREENTGGTGNWGIVHTISDMISSDGYARHTGLHTLNVEGVPTLVGLYSETSTNDVNAIRSTDGITWTEVDTVIATGAGDCGRSIVYQNKLYWRYVTNTGIVEYDPAIDSAVIVGGVAFTGGNCTQDFCVHSNELFMLGTTDTGNTSTFRLWQKIGSSFTQVHNFTSATNGVTGEQGATCLFSDGTDLYAICNGQDTGVTGNTMFRIQNPGEAGQVVTEITDTVIPTRFRAGGAAATTTTNRWFSYADNDTDPTSPEIYLWRLPSQFNSAYDVFHFVDFSTVLEEMGSLSWEITLPNTKFGGGERISSTTASKVYAELEQLTTIAGSGAGVQVQFSYRVYGTGTDKTATLYVDGGEEIPSVVATLTAAATGGSSSRSGNTIIDVTPDDGATLYTGVWDTGADGFAATDNVHLQLDLT
jgi:hypothetical protein